MENILCPHCGCPLRFVGVTDIDVEDCGTLYEIYDGKCFTCNKKYTWTKYYTFFSISPLEETSDEDY